LRILKVNKYFRPKGGSETVFFQQKELLEGKGYDVVPFSMKEDFSLQSKYSEYFVDNVNYEAGGFKSKISNAIKVLYSFDAKKKLEELLLKERIDIAHFHIFQHQISPSVFDVLDKNHIPKVLTLHDLKPFCPNYRMYSNGKVCEKCKGGKFINCTLNKCNDNSLFKSLVNTVEMYLHYKLKYYQNVDAYIAVSEFYRNKAIEFGVPEEKVFLIRNSVDLDSYELNLNSDEYFLYFGRLSEEKGLESLIKTFTELPNSKLVIAGDGPQKDALHVLVGNLGLENVEFKGFVNGDELIDLIANARSTIVPSVWYENCPMSIIESLALGTPVIGSDIGGIPEMLVSKKWAFAPMNQNELKTCINDMQELDLNNYKALRVKSREFAENNFDKTKQIYQLEEVYKFVLEKNYEC